MNNGLTVVILTKNEERHIVDVVVNSWKVADVVLVVDSGSTDRTVELAEANGAKVVYRAWDNDFSAQRNFALEHVDTEWVLYLDADERMNELLVGAIKRELQNPRNAMYRFIRMNNAFGRNFKYGVLGPDSVLRMFEKNKAKWEGKVHESLTSDLPVVTLNGFLEHYTYNDFEHYLTKMNLYASIGAYKYLESGKNVNVLKDLIMRPLVSFMKMYLLKKGFLEGWMGFVLSVEYANYTLNKYVILKMLTESRYKKRG